MLTALAIGAFSAYTMFALVWGLTHPPIRRSP